MNKNNERIELACYTKMSEMKGINTASEYIEEAIKRGWKGIGIADFDSTQSFIEAEEYIRKKEIKNFKIVYGLKMKFIEDKEKSKPEAKAYNIMILVKEQEGLKNLYTLLSKAFENGTERTPIVLKSELNKYRKGLLYGTYGEKGEIYYNLYRNNEIEKINNIVKYYDFIQIEPISNKETIEINKKIIKLGNENNIIICATSNPLFIKEEDKICSRILNHCQGKRNIETDNERHLHTTEEMLSKFSYISKEEAEKIVIINTNKILEKCDNISIIENNYDPKYPEIENSKESIKEKCYKKVHEIYGNELPKEIEERLELELNSILKNNYETIYLLAEEVIEKSNELGYPVGARGSVRKLICSIFIRNSRI